MGETFIWEFFSRPMLTLEQQIMMEGLVSHMRGAVEQWSDHHNSVYINLMIDSFFFTQIGSKFALAGRGVSAAGSWLSRIRTRGNLAKEKGQWGDQA